ncbi:sigma-70 family RNA polymerase sigma factor [Mediterraneibacter massiliensis]|uniref:sigma-70 family RNA polymerase sigma factor n=1 Tax=Mediterraneibacter massiliensis TaxID=1720300 RepID=UPI00073F9CCE|nr:sigma-70 family RNA polymerase sigma factor [Mediterraneibacter massiliensis]RGT75133.1 sigma-70 family RNA polymerase sigma factor [Ruminococcus sp. AF18-22]
MTNEQLVALIQAHENVAGNMLTLWEQNRGVIWKIAVKYSHYAEMDDLKQESYIALHEAVRHYEPKKEILFINYAAFWIKQRIRRYIDNCCSVVRIPVGAREAVRRYKNICSEYYKYYGAEPSESELCAFLGVNQKELRRVQENARKGQIQSLSAPIGADNEEMTLEDTVASGEDLEEDCTSRLDWENMKRELWIAVDSLPADQAQTIRCRYMDGMTLKETGEKQGISINRVSDINNKALKALRLPRRSRKFRAYYEQYLSAAPIHHTSMQSFRQTWTSDVEREALRWAEKELGYI